MKLIVGLGNKGSSYNNTRHNVGFMVIDNYIEKKQYTEFKEKLNGQMLETIISDEKIIFLKPQLFMNLSGEVVRKYVNFYKIHINDILIIHDDLDLELGKYKLKETGSSGGHNGLKNIEENLKTQNYKRLKIGISNNKTLGTKDYVLGHFSKEEKEILHNVINLSENIIDDFIKYDFNKLMNKYNHK